MRETCWRMLSPTRPLSRAHRKQAASLQSGGCELASGAEAVRPTLACSLTLDSSMLRCFVPCCNFGYIDYLGTSCYKVLSQYLFWVIAICYCLNLRRHLGRMKRCSSTQATVTTMRALRPPWQSCDGSWPLRVKPLWVVTDMKLAGIKAAMSSMALFDVVNTSAWIWRVQHGGLDGVRGWQPELGQDEGESANNLQARRLGYVQTTRRLLGRQLVWV